MGRERPKPVFALVLAVFIASAIEAGAAQSIFGWQDQGGVRHYTNDLSSVPDDARSRVVTISGWERAEPLPEAGRPPNAPGATAVGPTPGAQMVVVRAPEALAEPAEAPPAQQTPMPAPPQVVVHEVPALDFYPDFYPLLPVGGRGLLTPAERPPESVFRAPGPEPQRPGGPPPLGAAGPPAAGFAARPR